MRTTGSILREKIAQVSERDIQAKGDLLALLRDSFNNMQQLLARLPSHERDRILVVLIDELLEVERKFTLEIADRITADELSAARRMSGIDGGEALRACLKKNLSMCMGGFHHKQAVA